MPKPLKNYFKVFFKKKRKRKNLVYLRHVPKVTTLFLMPARLSPPWTPPPNLLLENTWIVSRITYMILRYL